MSPVRVRLSSIERPTRERATMSHRSKTSLLSSRCLIVPLLVLAEQFSGGNGLLAARAQPAVADEPAGPVAVVAPLVGEVALLAFSALVDGRLPARRAARRRRGNGRGLAGAGWRARKAFCLQAEEQ
jgi:hypothetical protein